MRWKIQIYLTGRNLATVLLSSPVRCTELSRGLSKYTDSYSREVSTQNYITQSTLDRIFLRLCTREPAPELESSHTWWPFRNSVIRSDELCVLCVLLLPLPALGAVSLVIIVVCSTVHLSAFTQFTISFGSPRKRGGERVDRYPNYISFWCDY